MANDLDLDAIEARANAATAGPWQVEGRDDLPRGINDLMISSASLMEVRGDESYNAFICNVDSFDVSRSVPDAEFIAHSREDVLALVREVRALRSKINRS
jgi:hypothetical protein